MVEAGNRGAPAVPGAAPAAGLTRSQRAAMAAMGVTDEAKWRKAMG